MISIKRTCPLCGDNEYSLVYVNKTHLIKCSHCGLLYKNPNSVISDDMERDRYLSHKNTLDNVGYVNNFNYFIDILHKYIGTNPLSILDYGCGHTKVLGALLTDKGHKLAYFDKYFFDDPAVLEPIYDVVVSTEVIEHFKKPALELETIFKTIKKGTYLAIMTLFPPDDLYNWWYSRDLTHVSFYNIETFKFISNKYGFKILYHNNKNLIIMEKD